MEFQIEVTEEAEADADSILAWLRLNDAGEAGTRWFRGMRAAIESLSVLPERCPLAPENRAFPFEVRQLLYGNKPHIYRILFTIQNETVYVLRMRHGRRKTLLPAN